jgi:molybdopterin synthase catalytic subunit
LYEISDTPLDLAAITRSVLDTGAGGLVTFVGYVRETSDDGRPVDGLIYEAHAALALAVLREIGAEAIARFGPARVAIAHRVGTLGLGEAAVAIAVAAAHRGPAFAACEYAIDELKQRAPIWKKERYRDGAAHWRENVPPGR